MCDTLVRTSFCVVMVECHVVREAGEIRIVVSLRASTHHSQFGDVEK